MKLLIVLALSLILLKFQYDQRKFTPQRIDKRKASITTYHPLAHAILLGDKQYLKRSYKLAFNRLNLAHFFTPSGLHLSSLLLFISVISLGILRKNFLFTITILLLMLLIQLYFFPAHHSLRRMLYFRLFSIGLGKTHLFFNKNYFFIFILAFLFEILTGGYSRSPISFTYSFIFFGSILATLKKPLLVKILALIASQSLCQYFTHNPFNILHSIFGIGITSCFPIIFIFSSFSLVEVGLKLPTGFFNLGLDYLQKLILKLSVIKSSEFIFLPSFEIAIFVAMISFGTFSYHRFLKICILFSIFHCSILPNCNIKKAHLNPLYKIKNPVNFNGRNCKRIPDFTTWYYSCKKTS